MTFRQFDSVGEAVSFLRQQEAAANAGVTPKQAAIGYGDHWMQVFQDVLIFGRVATLDTIRADELALGADDVEVAETLAMTQAAHRRGYRYGQAFSVIEPQGEWGSTHVSVMIPITEEQFEQARALDWDCNQLVADPSTHAWLLNALSFHD